MTPLVLLDALAGELEPLQLEVVFFGGIVVSLHLDDLPAGEEHRETDDIDCVPILVRSGQQMDALEQRLHARSWTPDLRPHRRNLYAKHSPLGTAVDFVPWFTLREDDPVRISAACSETCALPSGRQAAIVTPAGSLLTKIAAFLDRGRNDLYRSHDLEDIASLLACCSRLEGAVNLSPLAISAPIRGWCQRALKEPRWLEVLEAQMPRGADTDAAFERIERLAAR